MNTTKKRGKYQKKEFPKKILEYMANTSMDMFNLGVRLTFDPGNFGKRSPFAGWLKDFDVRQLHNLRRSPYFEYQDGKFYITEKGRIKIIEYILRNKRTGVKKWDGYWRAIIFDIPEASRRERNFLRKELRWIGCKEIQKSVWITPLDFEKELLTILHLWKRDFNGDIRFLKIKYITDHEKLRKEFNI